ncbi:hypothetical protein Gorai_020726, partial [Gossypium raimondii]|nr:hypothetical protein [Gossypium raimondii]
MWVPSLPEKGIPVPESNTLVRLVSNLINPQTRQWIEQKLTSHLTDEVAKRDIFLLLGIYWTIWWFGGDEPSGEFAVQSAYKILLHEDISPENKLPVGRIEYERWRPPDSPFLKINYDVAFNGKEMRSCTGIVVRNGGGQVVGSREIVNCHIPTGFATDALVCLQAMSLGVDLGFREGPKIKVEMFSRCSYRHVSRYANTVAHILAKRGVDEGWECLLAKSLEWDLEEFGGSEGIGIVFRRRLNDGVFVVEEQGWGMRLSGIGERVGFLGEGCAIGLEIQMFLGCWTWDNGRGT